VTAGIGSPNTAKTHRDNGRSYILPTLGDRGVAVMTGLDLDDLYNALENDRGLSASVVARCHVQIRAMLSWALRKNSLMSTRCCRPMSRPA
jgi:hypothetical protein